MAKGKKVIITDSVVNRSNLQFTGLDSEDTDYESLSLDDLKAILRKRGLSVRWRHMKESEEEYKTALIERLKSAPEPDHGSENIAGEHFDGGAGFTMPDWSTIDEKDLSNLAKIKKKYKSPEYAVPDRLTKYPAKLVIGTLLLYSIAIISAYIYLHAEVIDRGLEIFTVLVSVSVVLYLIITKGNREVTRETRLMKAPEVVEMAFIIGLFLIFILIPLYYFATYDDVTFPLCSSLLLIVIPIVIEANSGFMSTNDRQADKTREEQWIIGVGYEEKGQFGRALKVWKNLANKDQTKRVEGLILECQYLKVRRRILDLEERDVNCVVLRELLEHVNQSAVKMDITFEAQLGERLLSYSIDDETEVLETVTAEVAVEEAEEEEAEEEEAEEEEAEEESSDDDTIKDAMDLLLSKYPDAKIDLEPTMEEDKD